MPDLAPLIVALDGAVPGLVAVYAFGSAARGQTTPESDLDLAVLAGAPLDPLARFDLQERLAVLAGRDVDLVDLRAASTVMQAQIVHTGSVVRDADPPARAAFETRVFSAYAMLNEERAGLLDDIAARGRVHA